MWIVCRNSAKSYITLEVFAEGALRDMGLTRKEHSSAKFLAFHAETNSSFVKISLFVLGLKWAPLGPSKNAMVLIHDGRQKFSTSIFNLYDHFSTTSTYVQETKLLRDPC